MNKPGLHFILLITLIIGSVKGFPQTNLLLNGGLTQILFRETELPPQ